MIQIDIGYPKFISLLISRIPLRASPLSEDSTDTFGSYPSHEERLLAMLASAMSNIVREIEFFRTTAKENDLDVMKPSTSDEQSVFNRGVQGDITNPITKGYVDFMIATGATGSILEGLTLLWVTEKVQFLLRSSATHSYSDDMIQSVSSYSAILRLGHTPNPFST